MLVTYIVQNQHLHRPTVEHHFSFSSICCSIQACGDLRQYPSLSAQLRYGPSFPFVSILKVSLHSSSALHIHVHLGTASRQPLSSSSGFQSSMWPWYRARPGFSLVWFNFWLQDFYEMSNLNPTRQGPIVFARVYNICAEEMRERNCQQYRTKR